MRRLMRTVNARAGEERIPEEEIAKLSSKSHRIAMATPLASKGVPMPEIVEMVNAGREQNVGNAKERKLTRSRLRGCVRARLFACGRASGRTRQ